MTNKEKNILAVASLLGGAILLLFLSPPYRVCETYITEFEKKINPFFFKAQTKFKNTSSLKTKYDAEFEFCQKNSSPGSCLTLFSELSSLSKYILNVPSECQKSLSSPKLKKILYKNLELIALLHPLGWLTGSDKDIFCQLKHWILKFEGNFKIQ